MALLLATLIALVFFMVNIKPASKPDCGKVMELFGHYMAYGTVDAELGRDVTGYKQDLKAVIRNNPACFPVSLGGTLQ